MARENSECVYCTNEGLPDGATCTVDEFSFFCPVNGHPISGLLIRHEGKPVVATCNAVPDPDFEATYDEAAKFVSGLREEFESKKAFRQYFTGIGCFVSDLP